MTLKGRDMLLQGKTVDYSVNGMGVLACGGNGEPLEKGDVVGVVIKDLAVETLGEVIWSARDGQGCRMGLRSIGSLRGALRDFRISDTLIGLQKSRMTGILTVECGKISKKVYIKNGDMVFSASNMERDRLGDFLLREGRISQEQFDHSVEELKSTRQRQGAILVRLGYLRPEELVLAVRQQVEEIILSLFELEEGMFDFREMPLPTDEVITLKLSAANIIYHGIKRMINPPYLQREVPSLDMAPRFSPDPIDLFQDVKLDFSGRKVIACIDGRTSMRDIALLSKLDSADVLKTVYGLMSIGMIDFGGEREQSEIPQEVMAEILEEKTGETQPNILPEVREMIEEMHGKYEDLGYYSVLGVKDSASNAELRGAYYRTAKKFHPDVHFHYTDDSLKAKLSDIFAFVYEAYMTLSNPQKRKEYDKQLTVGPARLKGPQEKARAAFEEGIGRLRKGEYTEAENLFGQAAYFDGSIADYHFHYALSLAKQGKIKPAQKALERALRLEPANPKYMAEQGFTFFEMGFTSRARGLFERALKADPNNARAMEGLKKLEGLK